MKLNPRSTYYVGQDSSGRMIGVSTGTAPGNLATSYGGGGSVIGTGSWGGVALNQTANGLLELSNLHNTLLVNGQLIGTGTGDSGSGKNPDTVIKKPWLDAQDGAVPFDQQTAASLGAIGTTVTVVSIAVPTGYDGVINAYSWNFTGGGFVQGSGDLVAKVLRNGVPVRNYDKILTEKGSPQIARPIAPLRIYSNDIISLTVTHVANVMLAGNLIGSFVGWFYPSAS